MIEGSDAWRLWLGEKVDKWITKARREADANPLGLGISYTRVGMSGKG